jgi:hypothetical protein
MVFLSAEPEALAVRAVASGGLTVLLGEGAALVICDSLPSARDPTGRMSALAPEGFMGELQRLSPRGDRRFVTRHVSDSSPQFCARQ